MMLESIALGALTGIGRTLISGETTQVSSASALPSPSAGPVAAGAKAAFDSVMGQLANDAVAALKAGEAASISGLQGRASAQQVVDAMMSAERTLQLAVSVRDKVVAAYQELTRMAI